jgi:hypothetical protein
VLHHHHGDLEHGELLFEEHHVDHDQKLQLILRLLPLLLHLRLLLVDFLHYQERTKVLLQVQK